MKQLTLAKAKMMLSRCLCVVGPAEPGCLRDPEPGEDPSPMEELAWYGANPSGAGIHCFAVARRNPQTGEARLVVNEPVQDGAVHQHQFEGQRAEQLMAAMA